MRSEINLKIVSSNAKREKMALRKCACKSIQGMRRYPEREKIPDADNIRPVFAHDSDKIIHSHAYTRYIDKTQVFSLFENDHITHRVLHVQFVSRIGKVIGRCLGLNEDLIEAISLGHDLGHTPFGHDGERVLNQLCKGSGVGYFCHNAQSVRLLMQLEDRGRGLNLSLQVMDGILAHNGELLSKDYRPNYGKTWEVFDEEYSGCFAKENHSKAIVPMTMEGCVARISDIIAYVGRDVEDAVTLGVIEGGVPLGIKRILGSSNANIIDTLVLDLIDNSYDKDYLAFSDAIYEALRSLKKFNEEAIYSNPSIKTEQGKIETMFKLLFETYLEDLKRPCQKTEIGGFFHDMDESYLKTTAPERIVVDFIAGMTDDFFNDQFQKLFVPQSYGYSL